MSGLNQRFTKPSSLNRLREFESHRLRRISMGKNFTINKLAKEDRPREKIIRDGATKLSDKELLVVILGRGISGESVVVTAERLWAKFRSLKRISEASVKELSLIRGIGPAKAAQIKAVFELGKRLQLDQRFPEPFIKWAGGKGQLLNQYAGFFPHTSTYNNYIEPFLGGGAVFFYLKPKKAILNDLNSELIEVYKIIKNDAESLITQLEKYRNQHGKEFFLGLREKYNKNLLSKIERAATFIYLNKAGFNGLHRVNSKGEFNVPFGDGLNPSIFDEENIRLVSKQLRNVKLLSGSFEFVLKYSKTGDFVYFDPPYYPLNRTSNFTSYTKDDFLEHEQEALARIFKELHKKGCKVMLSNSDTEFVRKLYKDFRIETVKANRSINSDATKRGPVREIVVMNY
jgi:DNA adenine methylase